VKPSARSILDALLSRRGEWVSALDFKRGTFGFHCDAVSQRIGELRREGYGIESTGRGGVASYRLVSEPPVSLPAYKEVARDGGGIQYALV